MLLSNIGIFQVILYLLAVLAFVKPLGLFMAKVYSGDKLALDKILKPLENLIYRLCGIDTSQEMSWKQYLFAVLIFNFFGFGFTYLILQLQGVLLFNPQHLEAVSPLLSFNTAASYVTNADWQSYSGETTMSYLTQMLALTSQNFLSAATGMSILVAFIRGLTKYESRGLGNFWVDTVRGTLYIFIPLSIVLAIFLVSQGVIQSLQANQEVLTLESTATHSLQTTQTIPLGPVASQVAIKQLGSNGGGFFNTNSAHPFENPTPLTNFIEMLAILLVPSACCYMYGMLVGDKRQGWSILIAMYLIFTPCLIVAILAEQHGNQALLNLGVEQNLGGIANMEGKETRFGIVSSVIWSLAATATSNGSVNSMLDSYTPIGGLIPLWMMNLSEIIFGGVGNGLYNMLLIVLFSVFIGGLMVGRTPEYLGKKIEPFEIKMASFAIIILPLFVLITSAVALSIPEGLKALGNPKEHGLTEMLYGFTSMVKNNGSSFAGLETNTPFFNILGGIVILIGRYFVIIPVLAVAGSLVKKKLIPSSSGTLATHTSLFTVLLISVAIILGALSFLPVLSLGPIIEQLNLTDKYAQ
ncbi:MAG: potassium-transporting ATPase subunit KdpA [Legionellaceae bacterium]|nr:potassium-transporting ATPase subunit KdpA [Legionellaceae bacterium]